MIPDSILQLLAKKIANEISADEDIELQNFLQQHPNHCSLVEILQSIEGEKFHKEPTFSEEYLVSEGWLMFQQELGGSHADEAIARNESKPPIRKLIGTWAGRVAVGIGLILLGGGLFYIRNNSVKEGVPFLSAEMSEVKVPNGTTVKKILPDSSVVWLNAGSHIRYDKNFVQKKRNVYLEGEAYFSVAHDANFPFVVHAGNITVQALGTEFNVQAYHNENKIEATLISGQVLVKIAGKPNHDIVLSPNEKLTVNNKAYSLSSHEDHADETLQAISFDIKEVYEAPQIAMVPEVAWVSDKLAFENQSFSELAKRMERRYDIRIIFEDDLLRFERLNGVFENESIQEALRLLQMTTGFRYQIQGDTVYINH